MIIVAIRAQYRARPTNVSKLLTYSSKLSCMEYDDPSNLLERVRRGQFWGQIIPVIYLNGSVGQTDWCGGYLGFYRLIIPSVLRPQLVSTTFGQNYWTTYIPKLKFVKIVKEARNRV